MIYRKLRPQYYNDIGLVNENGEKWHSLRRNLTPPLSSPERVGLINCVVVYLDKIYLDIIYSLMIDDGRETIVRE